MRLRLSNLKRTKKRKLVLAIILIFILVIGGYFLLDYIEWRKTEKDMLISSSSVVPIKDYKIKDTAEGRVVENKKAGLIMPVPEGWSVETGIKVGEGGVAFLSPEAELDGVFLKE